MRLSQGFRSGFRHGRAGFALRRCGRLKSQMVRRIREERSRILLKVEDFHGLGEGDSVLLRVRPTGRDDDYPTAFDIEIPVKWWNAQPYVQSKSWMHGGGYSFPRPLQELAGFITDPRDGAGCSADARLVDPSRVRRPCGCASREAGAVRVAVRSSTTTVTGDEQPIQWLPPSEPPSPELVYRRLGEFVVVVQWVENELLDMVTRLHAGDAFWEARADFIKTTFAEKVQRARELFECRMRELEASRPEVAEAASAWRPRFAEIADGCDRLRRRRNVVVHSTYVHLEAAGEVHGIVRSKAGRHQGEVVFDQSDALGEVDAALGDAAQLCFDLGLAKKQVVWWQDLWAALPR
jgi:hypothetical protein